MGNRALYRMLYFLFSSYPVHVSSMPRKYFVAREVKRWPKTGDRQENGRKKKDGNLNEWKGKKRWRQQRRVAKNEEDKK